MAVYDTPLGGNPQLDPLRKKRIGDISDVTARLGIPAGLVPPQNTGPKLFHSPVQPGLPRPVAPPPVTAYGAGQAAREGVGAAVNVGVRAADALTQPLRDQMQAGTQFARGLFGAAPAPAALPSPIAAAQVAPVNKPPSMTLFDASNPSNFNVRPPSANVAPARNPASPASPGGSGSAGGVPALVLKPGDANTFTGADGVTRAVPQMATPAAGSVQTQSFGNLPRPQTAGVAAASPSATPTETITPTVSLPRPAQASIGQVGAYGVQNADAGTSKIASTLEDAAFRAGLRASRGSRSATDAQAQILGTLAQLGGQRLGVAAGLAGGDRDATAATDRTALGETGANQRSALDDIGATARQGMKGASEERVAQLDTLAKLAAPTTITDADGRLLRVTGAASTPVIGGDGKTVRMPLDGAITPALALASLTKQLEAEANALQPDMTRLGALQRQIDALSRPAANTVSTPAAHTATNSRTGERVRYNPQTKSWEPIPSAG